MPGFAFRLVGREVFSLDFFSKKDIIPFDQALLRLINETTGTSSITKSNAYERQVWVHACIKAIAMNISRVPFRLYRGTSKDSREVVDGPVYNLLTRPNPYQSQSELNEGIQIWKQASGEAFVRIEKVGNIPLRLRILPADRVQENRDYTNIFTSWKYVSPRGVTEIIPREDLLHFKFFNRHSNRGLSPITAARETLTEDTLGRNFTKEVLQNGYFPGSVIETEKALNDPQYARIQKQLNDRHGGEGKKGKLMLLEGGLKYKEVKVSAEDIKYIEQKKLTKEELHSIYRVPVAITGDTSAFNRANMIAIMRMFWTQTLIPELVKMAQIYNRFLLEPYYSGIWGQFDLSVIEELTEYMLGMLDSAAKMFAMGIPVVEINRRLNLGLEVEKYPWLFTWYKPFNLDPVMEPSTTPENQRGTAAVSDMLKAFSDFSEKIKRKNDDERQINFKKWEKLIRGINPIEKAYASKLSKWIFELRGEVLDNFFKSCKDIVIKQTLFNERAQIKKLQKLSEPFITQGLETGGRVAFGEIGLEAANFSVTTQGAIAALTLRGERLSNIVSRLGEGVDNVLSSGISQGLSTQQVADNLRTFFKNAENRRKTIARTEINGAANEGKYLGWQQAGIDRHQWLDSFDDDVRDSHARVSGEIVPVGSPFGNGLLYPGDPGGDAAEIINCRCTTIAVMEEK